MTDRDLLRAAGEALDGAQWQRALARRLGKYAPSGPRESIDDRYVRRVAAGTHRAPAWWWPAIAAELVDRRERLADDAAAIDAALESVHHLHRHTTPPIT